MNIQQAKDQIKNTIIAYRTQDRFGHPAIPVQRQRPVFLLGAPGIGKTAIIEQIAQEMELPLVSYSMTHHTRQSALGLPFIREREFDRQSFRVTEYTMSEIIASVYDKMEATGRREGILFLDEINCVSETLAPAMLQFLQYKIFGQHRVPDGWIVVTAGNPPEYNGSVHEFDIVTWDRLKRMEVEPDYEVWREFAISQYAHPAIISYLDIRKADFCLNESSIDGRQFVTPRGWMDLSDMICLYEQHDMKVDESLVRQYLQHPYVAKQFSIYYDLWQKYRSDYQAQQILDGKAGKDIVERAKKAEFDERIALIGLLMDAIRGEVSRNMNSRAVLEAEQKLIRDARIMAASKKMKFSDAMKTCDAQRQDMLKKKRAGQMISVSEERQQQALHQWMQDITPLISDQAGDRQAFETVRSHFDNQVREMKNEATAVGNRLDCLFAFSEEAFGEGQEMLILVTELTASPDVTRFISLYGCEAYFRHNKELLFFERQMEVVREIEELDLD